MPTTNYQPKSERVVPEPVYNDKGKIDRNLLSYSQRRFIAKLGEYKGIISKACKASEVSKEAVYRWRDRNANFRVLMERTNDNVVDYVNSLLMDKVDDGNLNAIRFFLEKNDPRYGAKGRAIPNREPMTPSWYKKITPKEDATGSVRPE